MCVARLNKYEIKGAGIIPGNLSPPLVLFRISRHE